MLIDLIILLIVVGVALYLVNLIPMEATIKKLINVLVIIVAVLYVLRALGVLDRLGSL